MSKFEIHYSIGGGYNVKTTETIEADSLDSAEQIAYECAIQLFESYGVFDRQNPNYDYDSIREEDYQEEYNEEFERWVSYTAEEVD